MNQTPRRPLSLDGLRGFEAVARRLSFSAAAEELHLTQPAISRQIKALEEEVGASLFNRGTRRVELTAAGVALQQAVVPSLERIDRTVRQLRVASGRRHVNLSTFASFATLWLMPRLAAFQQAHPDIDIRISASDKLIELDDPEVDLLLRYDFAANVPHDAEPLFGEVLTPVASPWLKPLPTQAAELSANALLEE
ncbi:MAG: LysR family transcriptional regulator, partial [Burkholderiales bacterium]|nr:LysR family transcriptional regulator [Burkholderiales bacterium]